MMIIIMLNISSDSFVHKKRLSQITMKKKKKFTVYVHFVLLSSDSDCLPINTMK